MATITRTSDRDREVLRRSALAATQGPTDEQQANSYPRNALMRELGEPQDPTNVSFPFLRLMRRDHMVAMGLHFIAMPTVKAPWYYEADDAKVAAFADNLLRPIYGRLVLTILRMLWAGYSPAAKNFDTVNPSWTYLPGINQAPTQVWDQGGIDAVVYKPVTPLKPENSSPVWDRSGAFNGITYDKRYGGIGYFNINGQRTPDIDLLHSMWVTHDQDNEDGSPFGFARIAHCAPIFHMYRYIWTLLGRAFENNADPGPVVRYPREEMDAVNDDGEQVTNVQTALRIGSRRRSGSTIAMPSDVYRDFQDKPTGVKMWDIEYPKNDTNFSEIMNFLGFLESAKLRSLWLQEQGLIEGSGGQSNRNVASEFGEQRDASQTVLMHQIDEAIDETFIRPAMAMNMPWYEGKLVKKTLGPGRDDEDVVRQIIQLAGQQDFHNFGADVRRILDAKGVPLISDADYKTLQDQAAKAATAAATPAVAPDGSVVGNGTPRNPVQGRRSLVTQTGFDRETGQPEMTYVQLGGHIELSSDGDFVARLPKTDAFTDRQVVATTRDLRNTASAFLTWAYGDFARYLGKQKSLDLSQLVHEIELEAGEELADGDKVRKAVDRIIGGWRPSVAKISEFTTKARGAIGRVFDRTTTIQFSRVRSSARLNSLDKAAATWLDNRGAEMVSSVLQTTREQLATVLADGVREGRTPAQIATDIREHFDEFPASRAATIARTEVSMAFNFATASAGIAAGVKKGQLLDGNKDEPCKQRNGKIVDLAQALQEKLNHPNCTFTIRLLPKASANLSMRYEKLTGFKARYDAASDTILLDREISREDEAHYLIALGETFADVELDGELALA